MPRCLLAPTLILLALEHPDLCKYQILPTAEASDCEPVVQVYRHLIFQRGKDPKLTLTAETDY